MLLAHDAYTNTKAKNGKTPLLIAVENNNEEIVSSLLNHGAYTNTKTDEGWTRLLEAVNQDNIEIVKMLLNRGANVNEGTNNGRTPIFEAIEAGNIDMVQLLLKEGARIDVRAKMRSARFVKHEGEIKVYWEGEGDFNYSQNLAAVFIVGEYSPLMEAVQENQLEIAELLLKKGAAINAPHPTTYKERKEDKEQIWDGYTVLMEAVRLNYPEMTRLLIRNGADINAKTKSGKDLLYFAKLSEDEGMIEFIHSKLSK